MDHIGSCFCGAVELKASGSPEAMGYCHCRSCRSWSGSPVNAFTLWKPEAVRITTGSQHVATFAKTELSQRKYCAKCGGHLMTDHPPIGFVDIFAATIPTLPFAPGVHVNYSATVLPMRDGLPKLKVFPPSLAAPAKWSPNRKQSSDQAATTDSSHTCFDCRFLFSPLDSRYLRESSGSSFR